MKRALGLTDEQVAAGLGAMRAVVEADGKHDLLEQNLLEVLARTLGASADVPVASPEQVMKAFPDELGRRRVLQAQFVAALVDGEAVDAEVEVMERYAKAFGLKDAWVKNARRLVDGQLMRLRLDFVRRMPVPRKLVADLWEEQGLKGLWRLYRTVRLQGTDEPELAWRYKQLGLLPAHSFGYQFWRHMTERKFAFPGEPGGLLEQQVHHDLIHTLTGYSTEPEGECQIAAFYAGYFKEEPFGFLFMTMLMFQVGVALVPDFVTVSKLQWDPEKVVRAMERGAKVAVDPTDHWDFWPLLEQPIDDVRRQLGIG